MILWIPCIYGGFENFINIIFHDWGNIWKLSCNIAIGEVNAVVLTDIAEAGAWKVGDFAHFSCHVFWDVADMMSVRGEYLDGILVVVVCWFRFHGANEFTNVIVDIVTVGHSCDIELQIISYELVFGPDADVVAFVLDAEVLQLLHGCVRIGFWFIHRRNRLFFIKYREWAFVCAQSDCFEGGGVASGLCTSLQFIMLQLFFETVVVCSLTLSHGGSINIK